MTPLQLLYATQGKGENCLYKVKDATRMMAVFLEGNTLVVGLGGTREDSVADWLSNFDPEPEALAYVPLFQDFIRIYQPALTIFAGHSQGGAHAEILAHRFVGVSSAITFGGLPTRYGAQVHYLRREDPMAWIPMKRIGTVKKLGKSVLCPKPEMHSPAAYRAVL